MNFSYKKYKEMLIKQDYRCKICNIHAHELDKRLSIDHCHKTNKIRYLLCQKCNWLLGLTHDDHDYLLKMANYLTLPTTNIEYKGPYKFSCKESNKDNLARIKRNKLKYFKKTP